MMNAVVDMSEAEARLPRCVAMMCCLQLGAILQPKCLHLLRQNTIITLDCSLVTQAGGTHDECSCGHF